MYPCLPQQEETQPTEVGRRVCTVVYRSTWSHHGTGEVPGHMGAAEAIFNFIYANFHTLHRRVAKKNHDGQPLKPQVRYNRIVE